MNREQAIEMQADAWQKMQELHASENADPTMFGTTAEAIQFWGMLHAAACRQLDQYRQENDRRDIFDAANAAIEWAAQLNAEGGLTKANALEVLEHIQEIIDQLEA